MWSSAVMYKLEGDPPIRPVWGFPGVKLRSNSNFSENSQVWYQIDQKIILNKDMVFSLVVRRYRNWKVTIRSDPS